MTLLDVKNDFPILSEKARGKPLVFLDGAASSQKPRQVIDAISDYYKKSNANIHRGLYALSEQATLRFEAVRKQTAAFINAKSEREIVFTKGTTEAINLVASSFGEENINAGDEIVVTQMEHHANIVPWQRLCERKGAVLKVVPVLDDGALDLEVYKGFLVDSGLRGNDSGARKNDSRIKLVALTHVSNVLGTINPVKEMIALARAHSVPVLIDGAQAVTHSAIDVQDLDCDFYAFSAHKMYGPTGVGVLYAKYDILKRMPPYQVGGGMIETVDFDCVTYADVPERFEAGTPNIAGVIGLGAAMNYLQTLGFDKIAAHEHALLEKATRALGTIEGLRILGTAPEKVAVISFVLDHVHGHDVATILDSEGVAVRAGHHCAMPLMKRFNVPATVRASFGLYNEESDVDALVNALLKVKRLFL